MRWRKKKTASLVVINYLELVESDLPGQGFVKTMNRNLEVLESTAESTQIPILVAQHTLRRLGNRPGPWFGECFSREWQIGSDGKGLSRAQASFGGFVQIQSY